MWLMHNYTTILFKLYDCVDSIKMYFHAHKEVKRPVNKHIIIDEIQSYYNNMCSDRIVFLYIVDEYNSHLSFKVDSIPDKVFHIDDRFLSGFDSVYESFCEICNKPINSNLDQFVMEFNNHLIYALRYARIEDSLDIVLH
jgi:hypothetical protein